jgi:hypothetical protein
MRRKSEFVIGRINDPGHRFDQLQFIYIYIL